MAYLLAMNELIPQDAVVDATSLPTVQMPAREHFVPDTRGMEGRPGREAFGPLRRLNIARDKRTLGTVALGWKRRE